MNGPATRPRSPPASLRAAGLVAMVAAPLTSHLALAMGQSHSPALAIALALTAIGAAATGLVLWTTLPHHRWLAPASTAALLTALTLGARHSPQTGLLAIAGTGHALLYTGLLILFANSLRPGHTALVTQAASHINPHFHPGMIPYTRKVTAAWALVFAAQLAASVSLLATNPPLWRTFVTTLHLPLVAVMAIAESLVRHYRWRHEHPTSLPETIRGVRRLIAQRAASASISS